MDPAGRCSRRGRRARARRRHGPRPRPEAPPAVLGAAVDGDGDAAAAGRDGALVAAWARFHGGVAANPNVGEVEAWLARVASATWGRWGEEAAEADRLTHLRRAARSRRMQAEAEAGRVAAEFERAVRREEERALASARALAAARGAVATALGTEGADALAAWGDDVASARAAWRATRDARSAAAAAVAEVRAHLSALGIDVAVGGEGRASATALREAAEAAERLAESATVEAAARLTAWRDLVAANPDLPAVAPDAVDAGVGAVFAEARTAEGAAEAEAGAAEARAYAAREALARVQGSDPIDVAVAEVDLAAARAEAAAIRDERDALVLALQTLDAAVDDFRGAHAQRLEAAATRTFATFSGVAGRRVVLDAGFAAHVVEPGGDAAVPAQLSQGARDQLAIALRLAVADLLAADVHLPLVFDDPFLNWDEARTERLATALRALARERQVVVLSHRPAIAGWGAPVVVRGS
jgi:chromosome segregation protein